jgi:hypothetical protein
MYILEISYDSKYFIIVFVGTFFIYAVPTFFIYLRLEMKRSKGTLRGERLAFCHIYETIDELKSYLTNERYDHLEKATSSFFNYMKHSEINFSLEVEEMRPPHMGGSVTVKKSANVGNLVKELIADFWWFGLDEKAQLVVNAYDELTSKITGRLNQGAEIDKLISCLSNLMLYEYSKIKKTSIELFSKDENYSIPELGRVCLLDFAHEIGEIAEFKEQAKQNERDLKTLLKNVFAVINGSLTSKNIFVTFTSWYILLIIVFGSSLFTVSKFVSVKLDSTLVVGLFAVPFAGAIAISTAIYSKSK